MASVSTAFRVNYSDVEPQTVDWLLAPTAAKAQFRQLVVALVLQEKQADLAQGLDRFGLKLAAITRWTRAHRKSAMGPADPSAPPLTPAYGLSRTRANLDGRAMPAYAEFFWRGGWGTILGYHRIGAPNRWARAGALPVRDVIGISPAALNRVRRQVAAWWTAWKNTQRKAASTPAQPTGARRPVQPTPKPKPVAAQPTATVPIRARNLIQAGIDFATRYGVAVVTKGYAAMKAAVQNFLGGIFPKDPANQPIAMYVRSLGNKILLNEQHPFWQGNNAPALMQNYGKSGWFSSADPASVVTHEVGHVLHGQGLSDALYSTLEVWRWQPGQQEIAAQVSRYAATKANEFVAETFAGLKSGKTYSSEVMDMYRFFHGPALEPPL